MWCLLRVEYSSRAEIRNRLVQTFVYCGCIITQYDTVVNEITLVCNKLRRAYKNLHK